MENILLEQYLDDVQQEGIIRGIGSEFTDIIDDFRAITDIIAVGQHPETAVFKTKSILERLNKSLSKINAPIDLPQEELERIVLADEKVKGWIKDSPVKKFIVIPNKIANIVI